MTRNDNRKRVTARFTDGQVIGKKTGLGIHKFAWQVAWLNPNGTIGRKTGFCYSEHSAQKMIDRTRRSLWGVENVRAEMVLALADKETVEERQWKDGTELGTGKKRKLSCIQEPLSGTDEQMAVFKKRTRHLIVDENKGFYTIKAGKGEYRVSKKTWCVTGWPDGPGFTINPADKL